VTQHFVEITSEIDISLLITQIYDYLPSATHWRRLSARDKLCMVLSTVKTVAEGRKPLDVNSYMPPSIVAAGERFTTSSLFADGLSNHLLPRAVRYFNTVWY